MADCIEDISIEALHLPRLISYCVIFSNPHHKINCFRAISQIKISGVRARAGRLASGSRTRTSSLLLDYLYLDLIVAEKAEDLHPTLLSLQRFGG